MLERLKRWARHLKSQLMTLWFCRSQSGTPMVAKILAILVVAYAFSPIDLIPDFIPVLGYLDDLIIVPLGIWLTVRMIPEPVLAEARLQAEEWIANQNRKPSNYVTALIFVALWLAAAYWAWKVFTAG